MSRVSRARRLVVIHGGRLKELPPVRIWRAFDRLWYIGTDATLKAGCFQSSIDAFEAVKDHAHTYGYSREVILVSRTGKVVRTRV